MCNCSSRGHRTFLNKKWLNIYHLCHHWTPVLVSLIQFTKYLCVLETGDIWGWQKCCPPPRTHGAATILCSQTQTTSPPATLMGTNHQTLVRPVRASGCNPASRTKHQTIHSSVKALILPLPSQKEGQSRQLPSTSCSSFPLCFQSSNCKYHLRCLKIPRGGGKK